MRQHGGEHQHMGSRRCPRSEAAVSPASSTGRVISQRRFRMTFVFSDDVVARPVFADYEHGLRGRSQKIRRGWQSMGLPTAPEPPLHVDTVDSRLLSTFGTTDLLFIGHERRPVGAGRAAMGSSVEAMTSSATRRFADYDAVAPEGGDFAVVVTSSGRDQPCSDFASAFAHPSLPITNGLPQPTGGRCRPRRAGYRRRVC